MHPLNKIILFILLGCACLGVWFVHSEVYRATAQTGSETVTFRVEQGESIVNLAARLDGEQVIRNPWLFKKYLSIKNIDRVVQAGEFEVAAPITLARVAQALTTARIGETEITILPGWNLRDIASYLESQGFGSAVDVLALTGQPADDGTAGRTTISFETQYAMLAAKPKDVSLEGYLRPDTFRIFKDATTQEVVERLVAERDKEFTTELLTAIEDSDRTLHHVLTVASIVEREVRSVEDKKRVADIFWRRFDENWALQADSTVHYAVGSTGSVFTSQEDRQVNSPWNTYKYPGLPPGPISSPSMETILATIHTESNAYAYFLTDLDGNVHYARTLDEHNRNVSKYLRS
jgi:UPF0755 protein